MRTLTADTETTGVDITVDHVVQIGMVIADDGIEVESYNLMCDPGVPIPSGASGVHGIRDEDVVGKVKVDELVSWASDALVWYKPEVVITFNGKGFDLPLMDRYLKNPVWCSWRNLDVLDAAYRYFPKLPGHKLGQLYEHFFGKPLEGAHDALADVNATYEIALKIAESQGMTLDELTTDMETPRAWEIMPIGKYRGQSPAFVPQSWASFIKSQNKGKPEHAIRPDLRATIEAILNRGR